MRTQSYILITPTVRAWHLARRMPRGHWRRQLLLLLVLSSLSRSECLLMAYLVHCTSAKVTR